MKIRREGEKGIREGRRGKEYVEGGGRKEVEGKRIGVGMEEEMVKIESGLRVGREGVVDWEGEEWEERVVWRLKEVLKKKKLK